MSQHTGYHSRYASNGFEEYHSDEPLSFAHLVGLGFADSIGVPGLLRNFNVVLISGCRVHAPAEEADHEEGYSVGEVFRLAVGKVDVCSHLLAVVAVDDCLALYFPGYSWLLTLDGAMLGLS